MNVLEKILEEIDNLYVDDIAGDGIECNLEEHTNLSCDNCYECIKYVCKAIICKHMNNGKDTDVPGNNGWIPVEERLPDIRADGYENVIITDKNGFVYPNVVYGYVEEDDKEPRFHEWDDEYRRCTRYDAIAWRPLPEAYKLERVN